MKRTLSKQVESPATVTGSQPPLETSFRQRGCGCMLLPETRLVETRLVETRAASCKRAKYMDAERTASTGDPCAVQRSGGGRRAARAGGIDLST